MKGRKGAGPSETEQRSGDRDSKVLAPCPGPGQGADMPDSQIRAGCTVSGPFIPEPIEVLAVGSFGKSLKIIGRGKRTGLTHDPMLTAEQLLRLTFPCEVEPFDGDARLFPLGVEAVRLGLAYEYDPFFRSRLHEFDPLPHQLEVRARCWNTRQSRVRKRRIIENVQALCEMALRNRPHPTPI